MPCSPAPFSLREGTRVKGLGTQRCAARERSAFLRLNPNQTRRRTDGPMGNQLNGGCDPEFKNTSSARW
eukprot:3059946-Amphidinium_carterae.1